MVLLPRHHWIVHRFIGAAFCATSVGTTARVLQDPGRSTTKETQTVPGSALMVDIRGLVVLAMTQGIIVSLGAAATRADSQFAAWQLFVILSKANGFLAAALIPGQYSPLLQIRPSPA